jgi:hypothetical protein
VRGRRLDAEGQQIAVEGRGKRRRDRRVNPAGLAAFEGAPCYRELVEQERAAEE